MSEASKTFDRMDDIGEPEPENIPHKKIAPDPNPLGRMWTVAELKTIVRSAIHDELRLVNLAVSQNTQDIKSIGELRKLDSAAMEVMCERVDGRFQKLETGLTLVMAALEKLHQAVAMKAPRKSAVEKNN